MKSGTYRISFDVELKDCGSKEEAAQSIAEYISEMLDDELFPDLEMEMIEEFDEEYGTDEEEIQELNFG
jgi:hypothetical protein